MIKFLSGRNSSNGPYDRGRNADFKVSPLDKEGYVYPDQFWLPERGAHLVVPMRDGKPEACLIIDGGIPWYAKFYDQTGRITETWVTCPNLVSYRWKNMGDGEEMLKVIKPFCTMVIRETEPSIPGKAPIKTDHFSEFELWRKGFEELIQHLPQIQVSERGEGTERRIKVTRIPARHIRERGLKALSHFFSPNL